MRNGSGTYTVPVNSWNPATNGVAATAADWQAIANDLASALTQSVSADGQTPITGNIPMSNFKLTGLAAGNAVGNSLRWEQLFSQGTETDIASAGTVDIGTQNTTFLRVTGTTTITSLGTVYNGPRFLRFAGALTLTHNSTSLILPSAANIVTVAGDTAIAIPKGTGDGWYVFYQRASGAALVAPTYTDYLNTTRIDVASATTLDLTTNAPNTRNINITGTTTITGVTVAIGQLYFVRFNAALTLTNNASIITQTGANITTAAGDTCVLRATAANTAEVLFYTRTTIPNDSITPAMLTQKITAGTAINTTSGTSHDFTSIPSWVNLIYVSLDAVSTSGSSNLMIQIGDSGGVETSGYVGGTTCQTSASPVSGNLYGGTGFEISQPTGAGDVFHGQLVLTRVAGNKWSASGNFNLSNSNRSVVTGGTKTLSATLDRIRLTTVLGTDTFDAGSINIIYQ
jgi:hypothetical protein